MTMIEMLAYALAVLSILTLVLLVFGFIVGPSILLVEKTENDLWWLLIFATAPAACLFLLGLIRLLSAMGG